MIHGIGTDILRAERVEKTWAQFGQRFAQRILMPEELEDFTRAKNPIRFLAMRFAAKEAAVKALGTGFAHGIWVRDVGISSDKRGRPELIWSARGRQRCIELGAGEGYVTLSDEGGFIVANAILLRR